MSQQLTRERRNELDGGDLLANLGIDGTELEFRKEFTRFDETDADRLAELAPLFDEIADELSDEFYDHIQSFEEANEFIEKSARDVPQLKTLQSEYLRDLGRGVYDEEYFQRRARIGKIHDMLDLGPKIYFGGYALYYEELLDGLVSRATEEALSDDEFDGVDTAPVIEERVTEIANEIRGQMESVLKLLLLDQQIAMDTYIESYSRIEDELDEKAEIAEDAELAINQLRAGVDVATGSAEDIGEIGDEQVDTMQDIANETAELSASIEEVASTAEEVDTTSTEAESLADEGRSAADEAHRAMEEVSETTREMGEKVDHLHRYIQDIDEVVDVIDDIAEQTNMLALNASIEAARADQSGDGFAVVADEVKSLAEESKDNAEEISELISNIQSETETVVEQLDATNQAVEEGRKQVNTTAEALTEISETVREASQGIREVADVTDDQAASTEEVASMVDKSVEDMEEIARTIDDVIAVISEQGEKIEEIDRAIAELS